MATLPEDLLIRVDALLSECAVFQSQLAGSSHPKKICGMRLFHKYPQRGAWLGVA